ncbi:MAG: hypothetical protein ACFFD8_04295 [Candidatus Thorarchaeota archaeon]
MGNIDTAKILTRVGALIILLGGFVEIGENVLYIIMDLINYGSLWLTGFINMAGGIVAVVLGFLILLLFYPMIDTNRINAGIFILVFGLIGGIWGFWFGWVGSILCLVAGILLFVEGTEEGA